MFHKFEIIGFLETCYAPSKVFQHQRQWCGGLVLLVQIHLFQRSSRWGMLSNLPKDGGLVNHWASQLFDKTNRSHRSCSLKRIFHLYIECLGGLFEFQIQCCGAMDSNDSISKRFSRCYCFPWQDCIEVCCEKFLGIIMEFSPTS